MANANVPSGLSPVMYLNGAAWNGQARMYRIISTDGSAYALGDPVMTDTGNASALGVASVKLASAGDGNVIRGVIVGTMGNLYGGPGVDPASPQTTIIPASKLHDYYVKVVDDPFVIFEIQSFQGSYTAADISKNCNLKSGTNNGYVSGWTLDDTAASNVAVTRQLKILGVAQRADNVVVGLYTKWLVQINNHELKAGVLGV
jgi:hypothetical protein